MVIPNNRHVTIANLFLLHSHSAYQSVPYLRICSVVVNCELWFNAWTRIALVSNEFTMVGLLYCFTTLSQSITVLTWFNSGSHLFIFYRMYYVLVYMYSIFHIPYSIFHFSKCNTPLTLRVSWLLLCTVNLCVKWNRICSWFLVKL